jgi:hypothetical protein
MKTNTVSSKILVTEINTLLMECATDPMISFIDLFRYSVCCELLMCSL